MQTLVPLDFAGQPDIATKLNPIIAGGNAVHLAVPGQVYSSPLLFPDGVAPRLTGLGSANRFNQGEYTRILAAGIQDNIIDVGGPNTSPGTPAEWGGWIERLALGGGRSVVNGVRGCDGVVIREGQSTRIESCSFQSLRRGVYIRGERRVQTLAIRDCSFWDCDFGIEIVGAVTANYSHSDTVIDCCQIETFGSGANVGLRLQAASGGVYANGLTIQGMKDAAIEATDYSRLWIRGYLEASRGSDTLISVRNHSMVVIEAGTLAAGLLDADDTSTIIVREGVWSLRDRKPLTGERRVTGERVGC